VPPFFFGWTERASGNSGPQFLDGSSSCVWQAEDGEDERETTEEDPQR